MILLRLFQTQQANEWIWKWVREGGRGARKRRERDHLEKGTTKLACLWWMVWCGTKGNEFTQSFYQNKDIKIYKLCSSRCTWPLTKASIFSCRSTSDADTTLPKCPTICLQWHRMSMHFRLPFSLSRLVSSRGLFFFCAHIYFVFCSLLCADKLYKAIIYKSHIAPA